MCVCERENHVGWMRIMNANRGKTSVVALSTTPTSSMVYSCQCTQPMTPVPTPSVCGCALVWLCIPQTLHRYHRRSPTTFISWSNLTSPIACMCVCVDSDVSLVTTTTTRRDLLCVCGAENNKKPQQRPTGDWQTTYGISRRTSRTPLVYRLPLSQPRCDE